MKQEKTRRFGLLMSIAMIVGIVIGSGIFFKADDILIQTNGNVLMGCLVLLFGAIGIIFGGITISEWAKLTDDAGGLIVYAEKAFGRVFAFLLGSAGICDFNFVSRKTIGQPPSRGTLRLP